MIVYWYNQADKEDTAVVFWNHKTGEVCINCTELKNRRIFPIPDSVCVFQKNYRHVKGLISVSAAGEHCVLATNHEDNNGAISSNTFTLLLCNALGTPIDTKQVLRTNVRMI